MNYATIKNCDIANGPGVRVSAVPAVLTKWPGILITVLLLRKKLWHPF